MTPDTSADTARWDEWQRANRAASRRSDVQARVVAGLMFAGVIGWLALALIGSSPTG